LQTLYAHSLERICKAYSSLVDLSRFALGWLTDGFRALTVSELNAARQIETGRRTLDTDFRPFDMSRTLKLACGQLIRILSNDIVTLTWFSTKEFFVNQRMTRTPSFLQEEAKVHLDLGVSWVNYLFMDAFIAEKHQIYIREIHMSYPLTDYAVMQWHVHSLNLLHHRGGSRPFACISAKHSFQVMDLTISQIQFGLGQP
jgi:hypothetical protein